MNVSTLDTKGGKQWTTNGSTASWMPLHNVTENLLDAFAELLAQRVADKLGGKEVYTCAELAERYCVSEDIIRRQAKAGAFGELISVGTRSYRITAAGVREFERKRSGMGAGQINAAPAGKRRRTRRDPGPI